MRTKIAVMLVVYTIFLLFCRMWQEKNKEISLLYAKAPIMFGVPEKGDLSIRKAIAVYKIQIPNSVQFINYNDDMEEAGLCMTHPAFKTRIYIGNSAFTSWRKLASVIAHEAEVHANQNWWLITIADSWGLKGLAWAEYAAYTYEIRNANRFGLKTDEIKDIIYMREVVLSYGD